MLNITKQQALNRWDNLPIILREAMFSERNADILWSVCKEQHLSEDKIRIVANFVGDVIMGFTHPEDLAKEIKEALGINIEIANSISVEINRKIFMPLKSEIDKVYAPAGALAEEKLAEESAPPVEISEEHIVDLRTLKMEEAVVKEEAAIVVKEEAAIKEEIPTPPAVNQVEPMIIHKEESAKPILGAKRSLGGLFGFLRGEKDVKPKAVEAKIEIGADADLEQSKVKVVHYSEFSTPVDNQSKAVEQSLPQGKQLEINDQQPMVEIESSAQMAARVFEKIDLQPATNIQQQELSVPIPPKPQISPIPPQEPKFKIKEGEEVIDLRTMKKITE